MIRRFIEKNEALLKIIFLFLAISSIIGYIAWGYGYLMAAETFDMAMFQILLFGILINITVIITLYELIFTKKKVLHCAVPLILTFISIFIPLLNLLVLIPLAYYLAVRNIMKTIREPKVYGGFVLCFFALGFNTITLVKSIEVYIMSATGVI